MTIVAILLPALFIVFALPVTTRARTHTLALRPRAHVAAPAQVIGFTTFFDSQLLKGPIQVGASLNYAQVAFFILLFEGTM